MLRREQLFRLLKGGLTAREAQEKMKISQVYFYQLIRELKLAGLVHSPKRGYWQAIEKEDP